MKPAIMGDNSHRSIQIMEVQVPGNIMGIEVAVKK